MKKTKAKEPEMAVLTDIAWLVAWLLGLPAEPFNRLSQGA